jgi:hypothetical protein
MNLNTYASSDDKSDIGKPAGYDIRVRFLLVNSARNHGIPILARIVTVMAPAEVGFP